MFFALTILLSVAPAGPQGSDVYQRPRGCRLVTLCPVRDCNSQEKLNLLRLRAFELAGPSAWGHEDTAP